MKKIALSAALALVFAPSALASPSPNASDRARAVAACQATKPAMNRQVGPGTFGRAFGTAQRARRDAFRNCVRAFSRSEHQNRHEAVAECRQSTANSTAANAFGKCVSAKMRAKSRADRQATMNAAKTCKAQQADPNFAATHGGQTFAQFYGTNANDRNAYGKCVSTLAKAQNDA